MIVYNDGKARSVALNGSPLKCTCGGDKFSLRHIHNPYGHDCGEDLARCTVCGLEYGGRGARFEEAA